jgi:hypothetical protein
MLISTGTEKAARVNKETKFALPKQQNQQLTFKLDFSTLMNTESEIQSFKLSYSRLRIFFCPNGNTISSQRISKRKFTVFWCEIIKWPSLCIS